MAIAAGAAVFGGVKTLGYCSRYSSQQNPRRTVGFHFSSKSVSCCASRLEQTQQEQELESSRLSFLERLGHAWDILFPSPSSGTHQHKSISNAEIAKQRLKMILISDRCSINDEARKKIVNNIVGALADFVEIEAEDKVQLNVLVDPDLGTVYSVTVPVRRVKPEYQDYSGDLQNIDYSDSDLGSGIRTVGIRLEYPGMESS